MYNDIIINMRLLCVLKDKENECLYWHHWKQRLSMLEKEWHSCETDEAKKKLCNYRFELEVLV